MRSQQHSPSRMTDLELIESKSHAIKLLAQSNQIGAKPKFKFNLKIDMVKEKERNIRITEIPDQEQLSSFRESQSYGISF